MKGFLYSPDSTFRLFTEKHVARRPAVPRSRGHRSSHVRWWAARGPTTWPTPLALCSLHHKLLRPRGAIGLTRLTGPGRVQVISWVAVPQPTLWSSPSSAAVLDPRQASQGPYRSSGMAWPRGLPGASKGSSRVSDDRKDASLTVVVEPEAPESGVSAKCPRDGRKRCEITETARSLNPRSTAILLHRRGQLTGPDSVRNVEVGGSSPLTSTAISLVSVGERG